MWLPSRASSCGHSVPRPSDVALSAALPPRRFAKTDQLRIVITESNRQYKTYNVYRVQTVLAVLYVLYSNFVEELHGCILGFLKIFYLFELEKLVKNQIENY